MLGRDQEEASMSDSMRLADCDLSDEQRLVRVAVREFAERATAR